MNTYLMKEFVKIAEKNDVNVWRTIEQINRCALLQQKYPHIIFSDDVFDIHMSENEKHEILSYIVGNAHKKNIGLPPWFTYAVHRLDKKHYVDWIRCGLEISIHYYDFNLMTTPMLMALYECTENNMNVIEMEDMNYADDNVIEFWYNHRAVQTVRYISETVIKRLQRHGLMRKETYAYDVSLSDKQKKTMYEVVNKYPEYFPRNNDVKLLCEEVGNKKNVKK